MTIRAILQAGEYNTATTDARFNPGVFEIIKSNDEWSYNIAPHADETIERFQARMTRRANNFRRYERRHHRRI